MNIEIDFKVSESATEELKKIISESNQNSDDQDIVRIAVQGGGCSGPSYGIGFVPTSDINPVTDIVSEFNGVKVVIDRTSLLSLDGTTVDWVDSEGEKGFKFTSRTLKKQCCSKNRCGN